MISTHISCDHNTYHIRFRDTWLQREKEATRPFTFQPKALEMFENQYKSELLIRSHRGGRGFESLRVHHIKNQQKCWFFLCSCGFSAFLTFANLAVSCGLFAYRLHRNYTVKCPLQLRRGYLFTTPSLTLQVPRTKGAFALCLRLERPYR